MWMIPTAGVVTGQISIAYPYEQLLECTPKVHREFRVENKEEQVSNFHQDRDQRIVLENAKPCLNQGCQRQHQRNLFSASISLSAPCMALEIQ